MARDFHGEVWAMENASLYGTASDRLWFRFVNEAEAELGHDLDGNESDDGYSIDGAYDAWQAGMTVKQYVAQVTAAKAEKVSA